MERRPLGNYEFLFNINSDLTDARRSSVSGGPLAVGKEITELSDVVKRALASGDDSSAGAAEHAQMTAGQINACIETAHADLLCGSNGDTAGFAHRRARLSGHRRRVDTTLVRMDWFNTEAITLHTVEECERI